jgi:hypothetical protein
MAPKPTAKLDFQQASLSRLLAVMKRRAPIVPFIGAGLSVQMSYPGWSDFLQEVAPGRIRPRIQTQINKGEFEEAAHLIAQTLGVLFEDAVEAAFYVSRQLNYASAAFCLPRIAMGPVVTTNFDDVLERVFKIANRPFQAIVLGAQGRDLLEAFEPNASTLIKIHGKATNSETRILTKAEYRKYYCTSRGFDIDYRKPLPRALKTLMTRATFLFVGCSLRSDKYLDVLKAAVKDTDARHFAILPRPTQRVINERVRELREYNIYPIWYRAGYHRDIRKLLEHLANNADRDDIPVCCPAHQKESEPIECRLVISVTEGEVDCLQSVKNEVRPGGILEKLCATPFAHFQPAFVGDQARRFDVLRGANGITFKFFPPAIDQMGLGMSEVSMATLYNGVAYWPRRRGLAPKILVTRDATETGCLRLSIADGKRSYLLVISFQSANGN